MSQTIETVINYLPEEAWIGTTALGNIITIDYLLESQVSIKQIKKAVIAIKRDVLNS